MKSFKLKFETKYVVLSYCGVLLCVAGFILNLWRCIENGGFTDFYSSLQYAVVGLVTVFAPVLLLSVIYHSKYTLTDTEFITRFGFIKSKFAIAEMTSLVYDDEKCALAIYTGESYMVFKLGREWQREFIDCLREKNKKLLYNEADNFEGKSKDESDGTDKDEKK